MLSDKHICSLPLTLLFFQVQNPLKPKYNGMAQGLKYIWKNEGIAGFFKGNGANCARIVPNSAVKFYSYEQASRCFSTCLHFSKAILVIYG